jgi:hypothetical protein
MSTKEYRRAQCCSLFCTLFLCNLELSGVGTEPQKDPKLDFKSRNELLKVVGLTTNVAIYALSMLFDELGRVSLSTA